jgi:hypothetical protein
MSPVPSMTFQEMRRVIRGLAYTLGAGNYTIDFGILYTGTNCGQSEEGANRVQYRYRLSEGQLLRYLLFENLIFISPGGKY